MLSTKYSSLVSLPSYRHTKAKSSRMRHFKDDSPTWEFNSTSIKTKTSKQASSNASTALSRRKCGSISLIETLLVIWTLWTTYYIHTTECGIVQSDEHWSKSLKKTNLQSEKECTAKKWSVSQLQNSKSETRSESAKRDELSTKIILLD